MPATQEEILISDLSVCQPALGLSHDLRAGHWRMVDYETDDGLKGVMLFANPELGAGELELPLNVTGPCKIYLGINYTKSGYGDLMHHLQWSAYGNLEVRLSRETGFTRVAAELIIPHTDAGINKLGKGKLIARTIQETYWKTADLTGQSLILRPPVDPFNGPQLRGMSNLSFVRLVPLDAEAEAVWHEMQPRDETRRIAQIYCAGHMSGHIDGQQDFHPTSLDWFKNEIAPCLNTDVSIFSFEAIRGGYCCYNTKIGDVGGQDNHWHDDWVDPLAAFTQLAHENGLKMFAAMRMIGGAFPATSTPIGRARYFWERQDYLKCDRDGTPTTSLSLAYPQVRAYWLSLLREVLDYGIDGITIYLHRFHPFVLYEAPVVDSFIEKFGEDPRQLPENDFRWMQHCADYVTDFLREVRALVNQKPGRQVAVTFFGRTTRYDPEPNYDPIRYTCDVSAWIQQGLVDYLWPMSKVDLGLVRKWSALSQGRVHIWPDLMPRTQPGEEFAKLAKEYYEAGADGFVLNDGERRAPHVSEWAVQSHLGHQKLLDYFIEEAPNYYRRIPIKTLMGFATRYSFNNFG